ncbi:hypothetical protein [Nakamurella multipartita]|uniref:hypothetical protein n=1 Tax=Nakamurella multipartita TaxID=53461 RepID=UPI00019E8B8F|nr:hypothetical protein [Nakamurella multipartita]
MRFIQSSARPADSSQLLTARATLSSFVEERAHRAATENGFAWRPDSGAPDGYPELLAAYTLSRSTGEPLPVSDQFCDDTVYLDPKTNMAFRYWHDVSHVRLGLSFDLVDELELANWHLAELEQHTGQPRDSMAWHLLHADLVGQIYVMALVGRFPLNQGSFAKDCAVRGFDVGVLAECRQRLDDQRGIQ